jgi:hypothetical protein
VETLKNSLIEENKYTVINLRAKLPLLLERVGVRRI